MSLFDDLRLLAFGALGTDKIPRLSIFRRIFSCGIHAAKIRNVRPSMVMAPNSLCPCSMRAMVLTNRRYLFRCVFGSAAGDRHTKRCAMLPLRLNERSQISGCCPVVSHQKRELHRPSGDPIHHGVVRELLEVGTDRQLSLPSISNAMHSATRQHNQHSSSSL